MVMGQATGLTKLRYLARAGRLTSKLRELWGRRNFGSSVWKWVVVAASLTETGGAPLNTDHAGAVTLLPTWKLELSTSHMALP